MSSSLKAAKHVFATRSDVELQRLGRLGFSPTAAIAWWSQQETFGVESGNCGGIGLWTSNDTVAVAWASTDAAAAGSTEGVAERAALIGLSDGQRTTMQAQLESVDEDGLTLRWTVRPSAPWLVHVLALGGTSGARVGVASTSPLPLDSDLVVVVPAPGELGARTTDVTIGIGAAARRSQVAAGYTVTHSAPPGSVVGAQRAGATVVDLGGHPNHHLAYLALDGVDASVGLDTSPAGSGMRRTRVGVCPAALLLFSWGLAGAEGPKGIGRLCIGGAARTSGCASWDDRNTEGPTTSTHVASSDTHALVVTDTRTGGMHAEATLSSLDRSGFTLDWVKSDDARRQFAYVALAATDERSRLRRLRARF